MLKRFVQRWKKRSEPIDEESPIPTLINQLGDVDDQVVYRARRSLVARGPSVVPALLEVLEAGNSHARDHAAYVLIMLKAQEAVEPLLKLLTHPAAEVRWRAAEILGSLGDQQAVEPLIERLQTDEDANVRYFAACSLGQLKDQRAFEPLLQALNDPHSWVRLIAAANLGDFKD